MDSYLAGAFLLDIAISAVVVALVLKYTVEYVYRFTIPYSMAFKACFVAIIIAKLTTIFLIPLMATSFDRGSFLFYAFPIAASLFILTGVYSKMIKHPESGSIGVKKGFVLSLAHMICGLFIYVLTKALLTY